MVRTVSLPMRTRLHVSDELTCSSQFVPELNADSQIPPWPSGLTPPVGRPPGSTALSGRDHGGAYAVQRVPCRCSSRNPVLFVGLAVTHTLARELAKMPPNCKPLSDGLVTICQRWPV